MKRIITVFLILSLIFCLAPMTLAAAKRGDIDGSGEVTSGDALIVLQYSVGKVTSIDKTKADLNKDGAINSADALEILRICVGLSSDSSVPTSKAEIVEYYNNSLKNAYYSAKVTVDYTHTDKGTIQNITKNTSEPFADDFSRKMTFKNGKSDPGNFDVRPYVPGYTLSADGVAGATIAAVSDGYKIIIVLKEEKTDILKYPVYNKQAAFGFCYPDSEVKSGTAVYSGTTLTLITDKNGTAKNIEVKMPYVCDYLLKDGLKTDTCKDVGEVYYSGKITY